MRTFTKRALLGALPALTLCGATAQAQTASADPSRDFSALLGRYVSTGPDGVNLVDYRAWRANSAHMRELDAAIRAWSSQSPSRMSHWQAIALWANLYNALTLQTVLQRYPVASIRDIRSEGVLFDPRAFIGPWQTKRVTVEGRRLSLDDIENAILRPLARDPRIHYAINCASMGCPNLQTVAWSGDTMARALDDAAASFINHPRGVAAASNGVIRASSIYDWYRQDFGGGDAGVIAHWRQFARAPLAARLRDVRRIAGYDYDWSLNDKSRRA